MKTIFTVSIKLIRWAIRLTFFFVIAGGDITSAEACWPNIVELIFTLLSLQRFQADELFKVITGFVGDDDIGEYEYTDNTMTRLLGWINFILALGARIIMLVALLDHFGIIVL